MSVCTAITALQQPDAIMREKGEVGFSVVLVLVAGVWPNDRNEDKEEMKEEEKEEKEERKEKEKKEEAMLRKFRQ